MSKDDFNWDDYPSEQEVLAVSQKGFKGIAGDIGSSVSSLPDAISQMLSALPGEAYASGKQVMNNPARAAGNLASGAIGGVRGLFNVPHNIRDYLLSKDVTMSQGNPYPEFQETGAERFLAGGPEQEGDTLLRGLTEFATGGGLAGRGMKGLAGLGARGAGAGLAGVGQNVDPIHSAVLGMLPEATMNAGKLMAEPFTGGKGTVLKGIEPADVRPTIEAARRLGLDYVTPGEASGFSYVGKQEGKIGNTLEGSKLREKRAAARQGSEERVIKGFLDKLDDKIELPKEKKMLYDKVMQQKLPAAMAVDFAMNDENIAKAIKTVDKRAAYRQKLKGVPRDSFEFWNVIKQSMDDDIDSAYRKGNRHEGDLIKESKNKLLEKMDEIDPDYVRARKLAQRSIIRRQIEEGFDKKETSGRNFYNNQLKSKSNFEELYNNLSEFPELQQNLLDMREVFPKLYGQADAKAAVRGERSGYETPRSAPEWFTRMIKQQLSEADDIRQVEAMTAPDWFENMRGNEVVKNQGGFMRQLGKRTLDPLAQMIQEAMKAQGLQGEKDE